MSDAVDHRRYLDALAATPDLDVERDRALASAESSARAGLDAARRAERTSTAELRHLADQVDRLRGPVEALARRAGVDAATAVEPAPPVSVDDARRMVEAVTADLRSAERSWDWVGREQARASTGPTEVPRSSASPPPAAGPELAPPSSVRLGYVVALVAVLVAFVVLVVVLA